MNPFSNKRRGPRPPAMAPAVAARQGQAATLAWSVFKDRDRMMQFLNTHHAELDARPIDLAIASDEGLAAVEATLRSYDADQARTA